ncbi:unnamed protein product [Closterium sp. Yama58-4]|nr:unnamed protein product [Closterium sp. Yama58-4]
MRKSVPLWAVTIESCSEDEDSSDDSNAYDSDSDNSESYSDLGSPESEQMIVEILAAREAMGARTASQGGGGSSSSSSSSSGSGGSSGGGSSSRSRDAERRVAVKKTAEGADPARGAAHGVATVTARAESDGSAELGPTACATGHATGHAAPKVSNNSYSATCEAGAAERVMGSSGVASRAAVGSNVAAHARSVSVSDAAAAGAGHDKTHQWLMSRYLESAQPSADPFFRRSPFRLDLPLTAAAAAPLSPASPSPRAFIPRVPYSASASPPCSADRFHYSPSASYYSASPAPYAQPLAPLRCNSASRPAWAHPAVIPQSQSATAKGDPYAFLHASPFRYSHDCYDSDEEKGGNAGDDGGDSNDGDNVDANRNGGDNYDYADGNGGDGSSSVADGGEIGGERAQSALNSSRRNPIFSENSGWAMDGSGTANGPMENDPRSDNPFETSQRSIGGSRPNGNTENRLHQDGDKALDCQQIHQCDHATSAMRSASDSGDAATWPPGSGGRPRMDELRQAHADSQDACSTGSNSPSRNASANDRSSRGSRNSRFGGEESKISGGGGGSSSGSRFDPPPPPAAAAAAAVAAAVVTAGQVTNNTTMEWNPSPTVALMHCPGNKAGGILMEPCDTNEAAYIENQSGYWGMLYGGRGAAVGGVCGAESAACGRAGEPAAACQGVCEEGCCCGDVRAWSDKAAAPGVVFCGKIRSLEPVFMLSKYGTCEGVLHGGRDAAVGGVCGAESAACGRAGGRSVGDVTAML